MPRIKVVRDYDDAHRLRIDLLLKLKRHDDVIRSCDALIARGQGDARDLRAARPGPDRAERLPRRH